MNTTADMLVVWTYKGVVNISEHMSIYFGTIPSGYGMYIITQANYSHVIDTNAHVKVNPPQPGYSTYYNVSSDTWISGYSLLGCHVEPAYNYKIQFGCVVMGLEIYLCSLFVKGREHTPGNLFVFSLQEFPCHRVQYSSDSL